MNDEQCDSEARLIVHHSSLGGSQLILEQLERANPFLIPLDGEQRWYRYHHLFAEVLRACLTSGTRAATVASLHRRASVWYEQQGLIAETVQHALYAQDIDRATRLLEQHGLAFALQGQMQTVLGWLSALPQPHIRMRLALCILHASILASTNQFDAAEARLRYAEQEIEAAMPVDHARSIQGQAALLRASMMHSVLMQDSFAALAPAVQEGQRISNGMHDILKLFLARIATIGLIILSSLVLGQFPLALRQGSLLNLLSVGIPTILLALWARPGPPPKGGLFQQIVHFVIAPVLATSAIGLLLFYGTFVLLLQRAGAFAAPLTQAQILRLLETTLPIAQTVLTNFLVICGLLLVIFVEPPTAWWAGGDELSGDWKPTILVALLLAVFGLINALPQLFALAPLGWAQVGLIAGAVAIWLPLVRVLWRKRLIARFLGLHASPMGN